jgi:hypothetical protein
MVVASYGLRLFSLSFLVFDDERTKWEELEIITMPR